MRLADVLLRGGHLSEQALTDICLTGNRPAHLDRCDICAERADGLGQWLDDVREAAIEEADAAFPAERLAAQQTQILRRLEQLDRPKRVITFPVQTRERADRGPRGVRPAWIGIAAAAGILLGMLGSQITSAITARRQPVHAVVAAPQAQPAPPAGVTLQTASYEMPDLDTRGAPYLEEEAALDSLTPHVIDRATPIVLRTNR